MSLLLCFLSSIERYSGYSIIIWSQGLLSTQIHRFRYNAVIFQESSQESKSSTREKFMLASNFSIVMFSLEDNSTILTNFWRKERSQQFIAKSSFENKGRVQYSQTLKMLGNTIYITPWKTTWRWIMKSKQVDHG